jgi:hypothetical protein
MSFIRSLLLLCFVSLLAGLGMLALGFVMGNSKNVGGYAVLEFDASADDRALRELLETGTGYFAGGVPVSESSQWVMLDDFGSLQAVPLDKYGTRLLPFDPRNDGYAGKLKDLFVRDGKRFIYIPLNAGNWNAALLDKQFGALLSDIPFSAEYFGVGKPLPFLFLVYAAASLSFLVICYAKRHSHGGTLAVCALLPALSSLVFFGAWGFTAAALFIGMFVCLQEPLNELIAAFNSKSIYKNVIKPYVIHWLFVILFVAAIGITLVFSGLKP